MRGWLRERGGRACFRPPTGTLGTHARYSRKVLTLGLLWVLTQGTLAAGGAPASVRRRYRRGCASIAGSAPPSATPPPRSAVLVPLMAILRTDPGNSERNGIVSTHNRLGALIRPCGCPDLQWPGFHAEATKTLACMRARCCVCDCVRACVFVCLFLFVFCNKVAYNSNARRCKGPGSWTVVLIRLTMHSANLQRGNRRLDIGLSVCR